MIFSKDKKPTETGWYWIADPDSSFPQIVLVVAYGPTLRCLWVESGIDHDLPDWPWGDKIETPLFEAPTPKG